MAMRYLILWLAAVAGTRHPTYDCSEGRDGDNEVCTFSQILMTTPAPAAAPPPTDNTSPVPTLTPGPTMVPTAGPLGPTLTPTTTPATGVRRLRPRAPDGTVAREDNADEHVGPSQDWVGSFQARLARNHRRDWKNIALEELRKCKPESEIDQSRSTDDLVQDVIDLIDSGAPVDYHPTIILLRDNPEEWWCRRNWYEVVDEEEVRLCIPRGSPLPGGGLPMMCPFDVGVFRAKVMAVGHEKDPRVWDSALARPYTSMARALLTTRATPLMTGVNRNFETNRRYLRRANGGLAVVYQYRIDGMLVNRAVTIDASTLEKISVDPELEAGVGDFTADVAEDVKDDSAHDARDKLVQLAEERIKVLNLKAKDLNERESERLKAQYEDAKRALVEDIDLLGLTGLTELPPRNTRASYLNDPESPGFEVSRHEFFACGSHSARNMDSLKDGIRRQMVKNGKKGYRDIVAESYPLLTKIRGGGEVIKRLADRAQIDHIYSTGFCHPANLFVDFRK